jgi:Kef-type K+ transport system membrane component KefB
MRRYFLPTLHTVLGGSIAKQMNCDKVTDLPEVDRVDASSDRKQLSTHSDSVVTISDSEDVQDHVDTQDALPTATGAMSNPTQNHTVSFNASVNNTSVKTVAAGAKQNSKNNPNDLQPLEKKPPICPARLVLFCANLFIGLILSQLIPEWLEPDTYFTWKHVVKIVTMFHLSYIMINVGFEFEIDKTRLPSYAKDYMVAMTAASFPWIFVSLYFMFGLGDGHNVPWQDALIIGRFAAPTSAGILFTMLEAAGMKKTWIFKKARILAIFDDLDTLLLMVPLKALKIGAQWELSIDLIWVFALIVIMYKGLHRIDIPATWYAVAAYAAVLTAFCETVYYVTHDPSVDPADVVQTLHLEILLPAFTIGCIVKNPHADHCKKGDFPTVAGVHCKKGGLVRQTTLSHIKGIKQEDFKFVVSAVFMVLVGLSMPSLFNEDMGSAAAAAGHRLLPESDSGENSIGVRFLESEPTGTISASEHTQGHLESMTVAEIVLHVLVCSVLMNLGKIFPACCYREEVNMRTRLALAIGMMPRGEVCAAIIVSAITLGASGDTVTIAVFCLAINMTCVSGFIYAVKKLTADGEALVPTKRIVPTKGGDRVVSDVPTKGGDRVGPEC